MDAKVVLSEMSAKRHVTYVVSLMKIIQITRFEKNTQLFHYFTHFAENDPKPKPQCETKNCCKTGEYEFDEYNQCERVCCDEENTLGPEEHCNKLDDHEFHCSMMNRITGQWTPTTLTQSLDDVIRCECEWTGVLVDPQYDEQPHVSMYRISYDIDMTQPTKHLSLN